MNATPAATTTVKAKTTTPTTTTAKPAKTGPAKGSTPAYRTVNAGAFTIIRLRGTQNLNPKTKDTLKYLRLNRVNHAVVLPRNATTVGMLQVAKDYVTWG